VLERPFDVVIGGTWWDEQMPFDDHIGRLEPILRRVEYGPPRPT
jgi:hypothetical protein